MQAFSMPLSIRVRPRLQLRKSIKSIHTTTSGISGLRRRYRPGIKIFEFRKSHPQICLLRNVLSNVSFLRKNLTFPQCLGAFCKTTQTILIEIVETIEEMTTTTITVTRTTRITGTRRIMG